MAVRLSAVHGISDQANIAAMRMSCMAMTKKSQGERGSPLCSLEDRLCRYTGLATRTGSSPGEPLPSRSITARMQGTADPSATASPRRGQGQERSQGEDCCQLGLEFALRLLPTQQRGNASTR